jgi:branched-chain amino acid transport system permease protein
MFQNILQQVLNGIVLGGMYGLIATGLTMVFGILEIINFAHGELYMIGAYLTLTFAVAWQLPYYLAVLAAVVATGMLGIVMERLVFRPIRFTPIVNSIIASMGLSIFLANAVLLLWSPTPHLLAAPYANVPINIFGLFLTPHRLLILGVTLVLIVGLHLFIERTWLGLGMRCMGQDLVAARLMGIDVDQIGRVTFAVGAALAAAAGGLVGALFIVEPHMGGTMGLKAWAVVILGGMGSIRGAILAGFLLGVVESLVGGFIQTGLKDLISFAAMILILLLKPAGLWGTPQRA